MLDGASDATLGLVLASPFEDIFEGHPNEVATLIEASVDEHPRLRVGLGDVSSWQVPEGVRTRVRTILGLDGVS